MGKEAYMLKAVSSRTIVPPWKIFYTLLPPWKIFDTKVRLAHRKTPSDVPSTSGAIFDSSAVPFRYACRLSKKKSEISIFECIKGH